jgi:hypothetical protein
MFAHPLRQPRHINPGVQGVRATLAGKHNKPTLI